MQRHILSMRTGLLCASALIATFCAGLTPPQAQAADVWPGQRPLLTTVSGIKPNVMITLDNSGSMLWPYLGEQTDLTRLVTCRADTYPEYVTVGQQSQEVRLTCLKDRAMVDPIAVDPNAYKLATSPDFYTLYYNPDVYYPPRVDSKGAPMANPVQWVANYDGMPKAYCAGMFTGPLYVTTLHVTNANINTDCNGAPNYSNLTGYGPAYPKAVFKYHRCADAPTCSVLNEITVKSVGETRDYAVADINARPDCVAKRGQGVCTGAEEMRNISNWYIWYRRRIDATVTAIGQAMAEENLQGKTRVSYFKINKSFEDPSPAKYIDGGNFGIFDYTKTDSTNAKFYQWMYGIKPMGGTPLNYATYVVGNAFSAPNNVPQNQDVKPWGGGVNDEVMSCRKSYHILFSDGGYDDSITNIGDITNMTGDGKVPPVYTPEGSAFQYNPHGDPNNWASYIPYPDRSNGIMSNSLSDLAAYYYWTDLNKTLPNNASTAAYDPAFWQNVTMYTIGYGIEPSQQELLVPVRVVSVNVTGRPGNWTVTARFEGAPAGKKVVVRMGASVVGTAAADASGAGTITFNITNSWNKPSPSLTANYIQLQPSAMSFDAIRKYQAAYRTGGWEAAKDLVPGWPSSIVAGDAGYPRKVDDFIHAGFAGGGEGMSVYTAEDVRRAFKYIMSKILGAAGNDAGVSISGGDGSFATLSKSLKYMVEYKTQDNSGDLKAYYLNAEGAVDKTKPGSPTGLAWSAQGKVPSAASRRIYTISGQSTPTELLYSDSLPADVVGALGVETPAGASAAQKAQAIEAFIAYLRGDNNQKDPKGNPYRIRSSQIASIVNAPPLYAGARVNMNYDIMGKTPENRVQGASSYLRWLKSKIDWQGVVFVPTNSGYVHAIAADVGTEKAAYLPRSVMPKLKAFADAGYSFEFLTDGPLSEGDIFVSAAPGQAEGNWNQMIYGSGGRGGKFLYALRLPAGAKVGEIATEGAARNPGLSDYVWEINDKTLINAPANTDQVALGFVTNKGVPGQTRDVSATELGRWVTLYTSGHYGAGGSRAGLLVVDAMTGQIIRTIALPAQYGDAQSNGLGGVTALRDVSGRLVGAYAGDMKGNLWRFDLRGAPADWKISYKGKPLFSASSVPDSKGQSVTRPIYAAPAWQPHKAGGTIVVFGTGILLRENDMTDKTEQAIFGIWDPTKVGSDDADLDTLAYADKTLVEQGFQSAQGTVAQGKPGTTSEGRDFLRTTNKGLNWGSHRGWYLRLAPRSYSYPRLDKDGKPIAGSAFQFVTQGERVIGDAANLGGSVVISSVVVNNASSDIVESCRVLKSTSPNFIYVLKAMTGAGARAFDYDGDGKTDNYSVAYVPTGGYARGMDMVKENKKTADKKYGAMTEFFTWMDSQGTSAPTAKPGSKSEQTRLSSTTSYAGESFLMEDESCKSGTVSGLAMGTGDSGIKIQDTVICGWSRSWSPILFPPKF